MRILGTICARGGSKGVKNKNIREIDGKPLIYYTIEIMKKWGKANRIIVSTDSPEIVEIVNKYGAETPFLRPAELASDNAPKIPVIKHALKFCEEEEGNKYDLVVDLDPTSPIRTTRDIDGALQQFLDTKADVLYSVTEAKKNPYFNMVELDDNGNAHLSKALKGEFFRRQDTPKVYAMNGSIYIYNRDYLSEANSLHCDNEKVYIMDEISSIEIDREIDFKFIEYLLKSGVFKIE